MPQNFYELVWIFIIYAFIGWCTEVSYAALDTGKFVNRGFLNGPYCPIYGCGVVIVVAILTPLKENLLILFAGSFLLTSVLEYITGYILEKVFHNKWWDLLGTGMYLYHGYHSSDHLCSHPLYSVRAWRSAAQYYHVRVRGRLHHHGHDDSEIQ